MCICGALLHEYISAIIKDTKAEIQKDRAVLLLCETISDCLEIVTELEQSNYSKEKIKLYIRGSKRKPQIFPKFY